MCDCGITTTSLRKKYGALNGISGRFVEGDIYELDEREVAEFDKQFPEKVKCHMPTQDRFAEVLKMTHE